MRKLSAAVDRFVLKHPRFGIPHLMRYIVIATAVVLLLDQFSGSYASYMLYFNLDLIRQGELWRLFTWIFIPSGNVFWSIISLVFYDSIASSIEYYWGSAKFTLYYLTGAVLTLIFGLVSALWTYPFVNNGTLNDTLFLAFATLYPTATIRIVYLLLPIQAKWLAVLYAVLTVYDIAKGGLWYLLFVLPMLLAALLTYAVFFWDRIADLLAEFGLRVRHQNSHQTIQFKSAVRQQRKKEAERGWRHKCAVCGRTDADHPELEFRYCSRCAGYHCFCQDHIFSHEHFTE